MINEQQMKYYQVVGKLKELKRIVEDEKIPFYKRNQAAAKYLEIEKRYFPHIIHKGEDGTYRKPKERKDK